LDFLENLNSLKYSCSKLVMVSAVGWEAQLRRIQICRVILNVGVGILLFASTRKGEGISTRAAKAINNR
jgi:hypothetical protein